MFTCGVVYDCSRPKRRHNSERSHTFYIGFCHAGGKTWLKIGQNQEFLYEKRAVNFVNTIKIYQLKSQSSTINNPRSPIDRVVHRPATQQSTFHPGQFKFS